MQQSCGRIDHQRRADDHQDICLLHFLCGNGDVGYRLTEEPDVRSEQRTVASLRARLHLSVVRRELNLVAGIVDITARTDLHQFAMQVDDL